MKNTFYRTLLLLALLSGFAHPGFAYASVEKSAENTTFSPENTAPENKPKRASLRERLTKRFVERRLERLLNRLEKQQATQDTCDLIVLKDSSAIWARITVHNNEYIRYVDCGYPEAPYNQIYWPEVRELRMADGRVIYPPGIPTDKEGKSLDKKAENNVMLSILGIALMFTGIGAFLGLIISIIALSRGLQLKKLLPNNSRVRLSIILSIIGILIPVLLLLIVLMVALSL